MIHYKIHESTIPHFIGIVLEYDFSNVNISDDITFMGIDLRVTQIGGGIIGMSNSTNVFILEEQKQ